MTQEVGAALGPGDQAFTDDRRHLGEMLRSGIENMPYNALLGIRIVQMEDGRATGSLALLPKVTNHLGGVHAGAQFALVEATSGAAAASAFLDLVGRATPLALGVDLGYRRQAGGDITAEAEVTPETIGRVRAELEATGRARFEVGVRVVDSHGTLATEATVRWYIRMEPQPA